MSLFETLQYRRGRVLFVSQRNSCRSQMAEAFARALGDDSLLVFSAGIRPAEAVTHAARAVMAEQAFSLFLDQKPKPLTDFDLSGFDVIVNLSGASLSANTALILEPLVPSPLPGDFESHRAVRDRMECFVRFLIEHFRRAKEWSPELSTEPGVTAAPQTMPARQPAALPPPDASTQPAF